MRITKYFLAISFMLLSFGVIMAQDTHFSQFYNSPLTLNPALTGKINGTFRVGVIYRNQWFGAPGGSAGAVYSTPSVSFDMPIRLKNGDAVGVGAMLLNDESKGGAYSKIQAQISAAYHKALGATKNHSLSLGLQLGYQQRKLDLANILFGNQIGSDGLLTSSIPSGEKLAGTTSNFDMNTGVMWNGRITSKLNLYAGISGFNLIQPLKEFNSVTGAGIDNPDLDRRLSLTAGADIRIKPRFSLLPSFIYMREATAQETNLGLSGGIDVTRDFIFYIGAYYRVKDAFIPYVGADYKGFRLGFSYDAAASTSWNGISPGAANGSFEISLMYVGRFIPLPDVKPVLYCPRF